MKKDFKTMTGKSTTDFIDELRALPVEKISSYIQEHESYFTFLQEKDACHGKTRIIYEGEDEVVSHTRDYGNTQKPQDYIEKFHSIFKR